MAFQKVFNSPFGITLALGLAQGLPPRPGRWLAERIGDLYSGLIGPAQVQAVAANQWVLAGGNLTGDNLFRCAKAVFRTAARFNYDFFHFMDDPQEILAQIKFDSSIEAVIAQSQENRSGQLLVSIHFGPFDLLWRAVVLHGMRMLALSYPLPPAGYQLQNRLRQFDGLEILPISFSSLHQAIDRLQKGGTVITAIDRPVENTTEHPMFFGRPSNLPIGWIRLALKACVPVVVISGYLLPDGRYCINALDPIKLRKYEDHSLEAIRNVEIVLEKIEPLLRQAPEMWAMFYPVWPEAMEEISNLI